MVAPHACITGDRENSATRRLGEISHPAVRQANDLLGRCIPDASCATIAGAAHFMIATHPKQFADLVARHVGQSSLGQSSLALAAAR
jgi:hypothetical protein